MDGYPCNIQKGIDKERIKRTYHWMMTNLSIGYQVSPEGPCWKPCPVYQPRKTLNMDLKSPGWYRLINLLLVITTIFPRISSALDLTKNFSTIVITLPTQVPVGRPPIIGMSVSPKILEIFSKVQHVEYNTNPLASFSNVQHRQYQFVTPKNFTFFY